MKKYFAHPVVISETSTPSGLKKFTKAWGEKYRLNRDLFFMPLKIN
jgi:hypothetical protein